MILNRFGEPARKDPFMWVRDILAHTVMGYQRAGISKDDRAWCKLVIRLSVMTMSLVTARECWKKKAMALKAERDELKFRLDGLDK